MKILLIICSFILINPFLFGQSKSLNEQELDVIDKMGKLTPNHDFLDEFVGDWNLNLLNYSGLDEIAGSGEAKVNRVYKGHYLEISTSLDVGATMHSQITIGYDTRSNQFFLISMDDVTNYPLVLQKGIWDKKEKQITFTGKDYVLMYKKEINIRVVLKKERENKFTLKIYNQKDKADKLMIEFHFIKKS